MICWFFPFCIYVTINICHKYVLSFFIIMKNDDIIMSEHFFKYKFPFYSKDNNIMKVNHSSLYMLLELNKKYLSIVII
jgi:hypothetical protein